MSTPSPRCVLVPDRARSAGPQRKPLPDSSAGRGSRARWGRLHQGCGQVGGGRRPQHRQLLLVCKAPRVHHGRHGSSTQGSTPSGRGAPGCGGSHTALSKCDRGVGPTGRSSHKGLQATSSGSRALPSEGAVACWHLSRTSLAVTLEPSSILGPVRTGHAGTPRCLPRSHVRQNGKRLLRSNSSALTEVSVCCLLLRKTSPLTPTGHPAVGPPGPRSPDPTPSPARSKRGDGLNQGHLPSGVRRP